MSGHASAMKNMAWLHVAKPSGLYNQSTISAKPRSTLPSRPHPSRDQVCTKSRQESSETGKLSVVTSIKTSISVDLSITYQR